MSVDTGYVDRNGSKVMVRDILYYDEGEGYAKGIHVVVSIDGEFFGEAIHYESLEGEWATLKDDDFVNLRHYTSFSDGNTLEHAEVIGNIHDNPEMLDIEWAIKNKPINPLDATT